MRYQQHAIHKDVSKRDNISCWCAHNKPIMTNGASVCKLCGQGADNYISMNTLVTKILVNIV